MSNQSLPTRQSNKFATILVAAITAGLLSSCGADNPPVAQSQEVGSVEAISETTTQPEPAQSSSSESDIQRQDHDQAQAQVANVASVADSMIPANESHAGRTPFGAYVASGPSEARAEYKQLVADNVAVCMADLGFDYSSETVPLLQLDSEQRTLTTKQWTETYGYGVSTRYEQQLRQLSTLPQYVQFLELNEAEKLSSNTALNGDETTSGCKSQGSLDALTDLQLKDLILLSTEYNKMEIENPPDFLVATTNLDWADCMQLQGEYFQSPVEAMDYVTGFTDIMRAEITEAGQRVSSGDAELINYGISVASGQIRTREGDSLAFIKNHEVAIAIADLECRALHYADIDDRRIEGQNQLLADYPEEAKVLWLVGNILEQR